MVNIKEEQIDKLIDTLNHSVTKLKMQVKYILLIQGYQAIVVSGLTTAIILRSLL